MLRLGKGHDLVGRALYDLDCRHARNRRRQLVEHGRQHVSTVLYDLYREGEISREDWLDYDLRRDLEVAVTAALKEELSGSEATEEVEELVADVVAEEDRERQTQVRPRVAASGNRGEQPADSPGAHGTPAGRRR